MKDGPALDTSRIDYLLNPETLGSARVTVVGLGSGGAVVCDHLTMNGVRLWDLYDPDTLKAVNLVKHPRRRADLGKPKVEIQSEWILDRNPQAKIASYPEDVMNSSTFTESVSQSHLVLNCPDTKAVREYVNRVCVLSRVPMVTASVFRTGIGGEIFAYLPEETGCFQCLQLFALSHELNLSDDDLGLTEEEQERVYGMGERDFQASGLSMDIQMIALVQARMALGLLVGPHESNVAALKSNWILFGNRPAKGIFRSHFEVKQMRLKPQRTCFCTNPGNANGVS